MPCAAGSAQSRSRATTTSRAASARWRPARAWTTPRSTWRSPATSPCRLGLGSSAAATVAGLQIFEALAGPANRDLIAEGTAFEGHPDNIAAAVLGGLTSACLCDDGRVLCASTPWPGGIRFVAAMPESRVKTPEARRVLPASLSRADAIFNLQRVALLLQALQSNRPALLREALRDKWHQPYRASLVPGLAEALALDHPDLLGVCLSGSGPTVVALAARRDGRRRTGTGGYLRAARRAVPLARV